MITTKSTHLAGERRKNTSIHHHHRWPSSFEEVSSHLFSNIFRFLFIPDDNSSSFQQQTSATASRLWPPFDFLPE